MTTHRYNSSKVIAPSVHSKCWLLGSITYSGIYFFDGNNLSNNAFDEDCANCINDMKLHQKRFMPVLSREIIVIIYSVSKISDIITNHIFSKKGYNQHEGKLLRSRKMFVVIVNELSKEIIKKTAMQNDTILIYSYINEMIRRGISGLIDK